MCNLKQFLVSLVKKYNFNKLRMECNKSIMLLKPYNYLRNSDAFNPSAANKLNQALSPSVN